MANRRKGVCALILALITIAVVFGCYQSGRRELDYGVALWTLEVTNSTPQAVTVGDSFGRLGYVDGMGTECFKIRNPTQPQRFWYRYIGEPYNYSTGITPSHFPFWEWTIQMNPHQSSISLAPAMYGCQP